MMVRPNVCIGRRAEIVMCVIGGGGLGAVLVVGPPKHSYRNEEDACKQHNVVFDCN
jgi:hypothetical protein